MPPQSNEDIKALLEENTVLVRENNHILKKMHRNSTIELWFRVVWFAILIGLPVALYFYILEPYLSAFGGSFEQFGAEVQEIPGLKSVENLLKAL